VLDVAAPIAGNARFSTDRQDARWIVGAHAPQRTPSRTPLRRFCWPVHRFGRAADALGRRRSLATAGHLLEPRTVLESR
jgi:hypothetical protein